MKEAGIQTHFIVAVGASLMMIISKYGFEDQAAWSNLGLDPSRIAAQVVRNSQERSTILPLRDASSSGGYFFCKSVSIKSNQS